jgi:hypothetical protein
MKRIASLMLGLSLVLGTTALTFAAQDTTKKDANPAADATKKTAAKKHRKHNKKGAAPAANSAAPAAKPAAPATK